MQQCWIVRDELKVGGEFREISDPNNIQIPMSVPKRGTASAGM